jgi:probable rRNA maturation factor
MQNSLDWVDVAIHEDAWLTQITTEKWQSLFEHCYSLVFPEQTKDNVSVCLTNDEEMTRLNTQYRQKQHPTNVLSFPQDAEGILGDVVLSYDVIQQEAKEQGKPFMNHVTHLFIHGLLHLSGHDHETPEESQAMENLEIKVLETLGIGNPYA